MDVPAMRKSPILIVAAILALVLAPTMYHATPESAPKAPAVATPTDTPSLPLCVSEDGAGMALCTWDARTMGNGEGTSVVSGDCAPSVVGDEATKNECMTLHSIGQDGPDNVQECNDIENRINAGLDKREDGFTLYDCYRAMRGM